MFSDHKLRLHLIPDGSTTGMSKIKGELDVKETTKGKGKAGAFANKTEMKKASMTQGEEVKDDNAEEKKLSKKELKK
jgi:hypothetical protein